MAAIVELPDGDVTPLLGALEGAAFVNLHPGVEADPAPPSKPLGNLFGARGPEVPQATWTPGEIGLLHRSGPRVVRTLAEAGVPVPETWYVAQDHPKRGLVVRTYDAPVDEVLRWLVQATEALCPLPITRPWQATVSR